MTDITTNGYTLNLRATLSGSADDQRDLLAASARQLIIDHDNLLAGRGLTRHPDLIALQLDLFGHVTGPLRRASRKERSSGLWAPLSAYDAHTELGKTVTEYREQGRDYSDFGQLVLFVLRQGSLPQTS
ncbi:hypothetical protein ACIGXM_01545 [Kitasatospora sp. NPDC052896]|uniref:hypothetical protein n=1 Tax=Kitasatospora sp. NPDC052896 TaxID=3364061 RepID=UPI0037C97B6F